jgi:hypothetical protein
MAELAGNVVPFRREVVSEESVRKRLRVFALCCLGLYVKAVLFVDFLGYPETRNDFLSLGLGFGGAGCLFHALMRSEESRVGAVVWFLVGSLTLAGAFNADIVGGYVHQITKTVCDGFYVATVRALDVVVSAAL